MAKLDIGNNTDPKDIISVKNKKEGISWSGFVCKFLDDNIGDTKYKIAMISLLEKDGTFKDDTFEVWR